MIIKCPKCDFEIKPGNQFCGRCGESISASSEKHSKDNIIFYISKEEEARLKTPLGTEKVAPAVAELTERLLATLIDFSPVILNVLLVIAFSSYVKLFSVIFGVLAHVVGIINYFLLANRGQTIGKYLRRIRVVEAKTGESVEWAIILLLRPLPYLILYAIFLITVISGEPFYSVFPLFLVLIDTMFIFRKDRRCIHDLIAGTKVVSCTNDTPFSEAIQKSL